MLTLNKYDQKRKDDLIKALEKAKEKAVSTRLYLSVRNPAPTEELFAVSDAIDHLEAAAASLGAVAVEP